MGVNFISASPMEALLQKSSCDFSDEDRRVARRWRLASVSLYGSIVAGLILYAAFSQSPDVNYASARPATPASHGNGGHR
jgi:hypothetical protein